MFKLFLKTIGNRPNVNGKKSAKKMNSIFEF